MNKVNCLFSLNLAEFKGNIENYIQEPIAIDEAGVTHYDLINQLEYKVWE